MPSLCISTQISEISVGMEFVEAVLKKYRIRGKALHHALLVTEESMVQLIEAAPEDGTLKISIKPWYNTATIRLSAPGAELKDNDLTFDLRTGDMDHDSENAIRAMLLRAFADKQSYSRKGDYNYIKISAGMKERVFVLRTLVGFGLSIITALVLLLLLGDRAREALMTQLLVPIQQIFLNALQMVTAPAVFFSITTSVARYASFSDPGKVSLKIIINYAVTTVAAILIGLLVVNSFRLGAWSENISAILSAGAAGTGGAKESTLLNMIVNFVPNNIVAPFLNTNAAQLLVMAVLAGVALNRVGDYSKMLREIADALDRFFSGTLEIISAFIPTAIFFTTLLMMLYFGISSLLVALIIMGLTVLGFAIMLVIYISGITVIGRLNPIPFLRKYTPMMGSIFLAGSGIAAIPDNLRFCEKKLGISPKISNFSIPFGAIANLDGNCIYLTIAGLMLAHLCGTDILGKDIVTILFMVVVLSIGAPIAPGSVVLALTMLLNQLNVPLTVLSMMLGVNALLEMVLAACNTVCDVAATLVVAKSEGMLNEEIYRSK